MRFIWNHAYLLMVLTALAWSGNGITGRGLNDIVPPIGLAFWRWVVAFPNRDDNRLASRAKRSTQSSGKLAYIDGVIYIKHNCV